MTSFSDAAWKDMQPSMWYARLECRLAVHELWQEDLVITSGRRPNTPGRPSLHCCGKAMDIRCGHRSKSDQRELATVLAARLGEDFDVVLEGPAAFHDRYLDSPPHIHIEYDPKGRHLNG